MFLQQEKWPRSCDWGQELGLDVCSHALSGRRCRWVGLSPLCYTLLNHPYTRYTIHFSIYNVLFTEPMRQNTCYIDASWYTNYYSRRFNVFSLLLPMLPVTQWPVCGPFDPLCASSSPPALQNLYFKTSHNLKKSGITSSETVLTQNQPF